MAQKHDQVGFCTEEVVPEIAKTERTSRERERILFFFCIISHWSIPGREHKCSNAFKKTLKKKNQRNSLSIAIHGLKFGVFL